MFIKNWQLRSLKMTEKRLKVSLLDTLGTLISNHTLQKVFLP